jgi:hypothetical protein
MTNWKPTLIVLALFAALLAYVFLVEVKKEPPAQDDAPPTPIQILDMGTADLRAVRIDDGTRVLGLERDAGQQDWRITGPDERPADTDDVSTLVRSLARLDARQVVLEEVSDPGTYGLAPPALTVDIYTQAGGKERILVGRRTPGGASFYVQREGDPRLYISPVYPLDGLFEWMTDPPTLLTPTPEARS